MPGQVLHILEGDTLAEQVGDAGDMKRMSRELPGAGPRRAAGA